MFNNIANTTNNEILVSYANMNNNKEGSVSQKNDFIGLDTFIKKIEEMSKKMDTSILTGKVSKYLKSSVMKKVRDGNFEKGEVPLSNLTASTRRGGNGKPLQDTGKFLKSIEDVSTPSNVEVGSNLNYSRLITKGGTIKPKKAKALCVPADKDVATKIKQGMKIGQVISEYKSNGWSVFQPKGKNVIMASRKGKKGKDDTKTLFILLKSVKIPKRNPFYIDNNDEKVISDLTTQFLQGFFK